MTTPTETFYGTLSDKRAWFPLDGADPTNELVGGLDLTLVGSPTTGVAMGFNAGDTGTRFTETTQWAEVAHNAAYNPALLDWSLAFWGTIEASDGTTRYLVAHDGNGDAGTWDVKHVNGLLQSRFAGLTPGNSSFTPNSDVKLFVFNWDRDGNHTRWVDATLIYTADISSASAVDVSATKKLYLARRETAGQGTVTMAHLLLRAALWTPTEMTDAIAARLDSGAAPTVGGPSFIGGGFWG